jgi:CRP-like cAMP-binding protein
MVQRIFVTDVQVTAAQMIVDRDEALGRETDPAIRKIADAGAVEDARARQVSPAPHHRGLLSSLAFGAGRRAKLRPERSSAAQDYAATDQPGEPRLLRSETSFWYALDPTQREALRSAGSFRTFAPGARLMREGERADHVVVILGGLVKVTVIRDGAERLRAIRSLGELIGERAAREVNIRSATVTALEMVWALVVQTKDFAAFVMDHPGVLGVMENLLYDRLTEEPPEYGRDEGRRSRFRGKPADRRRAASSPRNDRAADYSRQRLESLNGENFTVLLARVVGFDDPRRTDDDRNLIREALSSTIGAALQGISDVTKEDRDDGLLVVLPPTTSTAEVIDRLLRELPAALEWHNSKRPDSARFQLRIAVNIGPVLEGAMGVSGEAVIIAAQLSDTEHFMEAVADSGTSLGIIISPFVYETVVRPSSDPSYTPIPVEVRGSSTTAWMKLVSREPVTVS